MTPIHHAIVGALLPECLKVTQSFRDGLKLPPGDAKKMKALQKLMDDENISGVYKVWMSSLFREALGVVLPIPKGGAVQYMPVLGVVVLLKSIGQHNYKMKTPYIVVHQIDRKLLHEKGWAFGNVADYQEGAWRPATDEEVEQCLTNLTVPQIQGILSVDLFAPLVAPLFEEPDELVAEKAK